jgi:Reverse transcriptase (RNA-dependent DNA polymerase).
MVRIADDTAVIAKSQEELRDMVNRSVNIGRKCGMEINIDKSKVKRVSMSNESLKIKVGNRELKSASQLQKSS